MNPTYGRFRTHVISAITTPLNDDQSLHCGALAALVDDQCRAGLGGLLVAGTMGLMQLLPDATYRQLIDGAIEANDGRCELLVGVGDSSLGRTRDRIRAVHDLPIDGVVVLTPSFWKYSSAELRSYYTALADFSKRPLLLYDLPSLTGQKLDFELLLELAQHPNIAGVKCSFPWDATRLLLDAVDPSFRIVPAQAHLVDQLIRLGVRENLDGVYCLFPQLTAHVVAASEAGQWQRAAELQGDLSAIARLLGAYGVFAAATAILNARGIPGCMAPQPIAMLTPARRDELLAEPVLASHIAAEPVARA